MKSNRFWVLVLGSVLLLCFGAMGLLGQGSVNRAVVYQDGKIVEKLDLGASVGSSSLRVEWEQGYNIIEVENGRVRISEADCPDGFCLRQGWVNSGARPIVCLPHRLVVQLENEGAPDVDAVVG